MKFQLILSLLLLENAVALVLYVNGTGKDAPECGKSPKSPCRSIRYTLVKRTNQTEATTVYVNSSGVDFKNESGEDYINIWNTVNLISVGNCRTVISCSQSTYKLFSVGGHKKEIQKGRKNGDMSSSFDGISSSDKIEASLKLDGFVIQGCTNTDDPTSGTILLLNATLRLYNSVIKGNGVVVYHPQIDINNSCAFIHLIVQNVSFVQNFVASPFVAAISLYGCTSTSVQVNNTSFDMSPISIKSEGNFSAVFSDIDFRGQHTKGPLVDITLAPDVNHVSFSRCNLSNVNAATHSAFSLRVEQVPQGAISVSLSDVYFIENNDSSVSGSAISAISRFSNEPANINLSLKNCQFIKNSALDDGGAVYLRKVSNVIFNHCLFAGNSASNGGAVSSSDSTDIRFINCQFNGNSANYLKRERYVASGGAILASRGVFSIDGCNFTHNSAEFSGSVGHFADMESVEIQDSSFLEYEQYNLSRVSPQNSLLFISTVEPFSQRPTVTFIRNQFVSHAVNSTDHSIIMLHGQIKNTDSSFRCPIGKTIKQYIETPEERLGPFSYLKQQVWCKTCPANSYMMISSELYSDEFESDIGNASDCLACPQYATCIDGLLKPYANYWVIYDSEYRAKLTLCPESFCHRNSSRGVYEKGAEICENGRKGSMCTECAKGYTYKIHLTSYSCIEKSTCWSTASKYLYVIGFCFMFVTLLILIYPLITSFGYVLCLRKSQNRRNRGGILSGPYDADSDNDRMTNGGNSTDDEITAVDFSNMDTERRPKTEHRVGMRQEDDEGEENDDKPNTEFQYFGWFLSLVFFYQLLPIVYPRMVTLLEPFNRLITVFVEFFRLIPPLSAIMACPVWSSISAGRYFSYIIIYWIEVAVLLVYFLIMHFCASYQGRNMRCCVRFNLNRIKICFYMAVLFLQLFTFVPLTQITLESINCLTFDEKRSVCDDTETNCFQPWQIFAIFYFLILLLPQAVTFDISSRRYLSEYITLQEYLALIFIPLAAIVWLPLKFVVSKCRSRSAAYNGDVLLLVPQSNQSRTSARLQSIVQYIILTSAKREMFNTIKHIGSFSEILCGNLVVVICGSLLKSYPTIRASLVTFFLFCIFIRHAASLPFGNSAVNRFHSAMLICLTLLSGCSLCIAVLYEYSAGGEAESGLTRTIDILYYLLALLPLIFSLATVLCRALLQLFRKCRSK